MKKLNKYLALGLTVLVTSTEVLSAQATEVVSEATAATEVVVQEDATQEETVIVESTVEESVSVESNVAESSEVEISSEEVSDEETLEETSKEEGSTTETMESSEVETDTEVTTEDIEEVETQTEEITEIETETVIEEELLEIVEEVYTLPLEANQYINYATEWRYLDNDTDPAGDGERTSWTLAGFDDSAWKASAGKAAKFGAKNGNIANLGNDSTPEVLLNQYTEAGDNVRTFFFRTSFELNEVADNLEVIGNLRYDDAAIVYINGVKVVAYDEPSGGFGTNLEFGGSNAGDPIDVTFTVDGSCLKEGTNIVAVEIHQGRAASSDVYFEMSSLKIQEDIPVVTATTQKSVALAVGADETSRNITWYADADVAGKVQYAVKNGAEFPANYVEVEASVIESNIAGSYSNQATMSNLSYNTEYVYRLVNGELVSEIYSFKTGDANSFSFLLAGDPQIGAGSTESDIVGWENTLNLATQMFPEADFLLSAGDQVNTASDETQYDGYLEHDVLKSLPMATVIGNHDSGSDAYSEHFNNPNETAYGATTAGTNYWYVYNNTLFMHINSNNMSTAEHKAFMEEAIAANTDVDWKVVSFHHSIYTVASHAYDGDVLTRREQWVPVFDELDVDVVLMGHDHVYARTYMMNGFTPIVTETLENSVINPDGILYITANSASGSKFYGIKNETFDYAAVQSQEKVANISNVEVTENSFKITTYRTNDMSVVDTFEIIREDVAGETPETSDTETPDVETPDEEESSETESSREESTEAETTTEKQSTSTQNTTTEKTEAVEITEQNVPLTGIMPDGTQIEILDATEGFKLKADVLQKYYGRNMYIMAHLGNGIGFSIDVSNMTEQSEDIELNSVMEEIPGFAEGFDTIKLTAAKEESLSFTMTIHANVGEEYIGRTAYLFKKSLFTGEYEIAGIMKVNEIGNVALETTEFTDVMIMIEK